MSLPLPLPLTAFENYMLADDRADYPMSFFLRLNFRGTIDRLAFEQALDRAVNRHPLLAAFVRQIDGQPTWVPADGRRPQVTWDESGDDAADPAGYIDLADEVGLWIKVAQSDGRSQVLLQFHHACTDGIGAVQFIEDLLTAYAGEHPGAIERPRLRPLNPAMLADRGRYGLGVLGRLLRLPIDLLATFGVAQFFFNRPAPVTQAIRVPSIDRHRETPDERTLHDCSYRIGAQGLESLKAAAKREGTSVNDLLVRDLLLAIDSWNARHNPAARGGCLRISVPVNLRQPADSAMPATNVVSMVFIDRRVRAKTSPRRLLKSIRFDTWFIKRFRLALVFAWIVELLHAVRGGFEWLFAGDGSLATAVLSNLGVQFDDLPLHYLGEQAVAGDAVLETIDFLPPIRPSTNVSLGVVTYAGELMISLQYDARSLGESAANDLLALFASHLSVTAGISQTEPQLAPRRERVLEAA